MDKTLHGKSFAMPFSKQAICGTFPTVATSLCVTLLKSSASKSATFVAEDGSTRVAYDWIKEAEAHN